MAREEAIKRLETCDECGDCLTCAAHDEAMDMAISALREPEGKDTNVPTKWISVEEEKPKHRGHYFIAYKFAGSDMCFYGEAMWHDDMPSNGYVEGDHFSNEGVDGMYVTHWMDIPALPEMPKEVSDNG